MSRNVEVTLAGPSGNDLVISGRTEIHLDPEKAPETIIDEVTSVGADGKELPLTLWDVLAVIIYAPLAIITEEKRRLDRFLDSLG
jgi:hypothetical protein